MVGGVLRAGIAQPAGDGSWWEGVEEIEPGLLSGTQLWGKRPWAQTEIQKDLCKHKKVFCCEGGETLQQFDQRACGVSILGDTQNTVLGKLL